MVDVGAMVVDVRVGTLVVSVGNNVVLFVGT